MTTQNQDPCNAADLKARQQANFAAMRAAPKEIGFLLLMIAVIAAALAGGIALLAGFTFLYYQIPFLQGRPALGAAALTLLVLIILYALFEPTLELYACLLKERLKGRRA